MNSEWQSRKESTNRIIHSNKEKIEEILSKVCKIVTLHYNWNEKYNIRDFNRIGRVYTFWKILQKKKEYIKIWMSI